MLSHWGKSFDERKEAKKIEDIPIYTNFSSMKPLTQGVYPTRSVKFFEGFYFFLIAP